MTAPSATDGEHRKYYTCYLRQVIVIVSMLAWSSKHFFAKVQPHRAVSMAVDLYLTFLLHLLIEVLQCVGGPHA